MKKLFSLLQYLGRLSLMLLFVIGVLALSVYINEVITGSLHLRPTEHQTYFRIAGPAGAGLMALSLIAMNYFVERMQLLNILKKIKT